MLCPFCRFASLLSCNFLHASIQFYSVYGFSNVFNRYIDHRYTSPLNLAFGFILSFGLQFDARFPIPHPNLCMVSRADFSGLLSTQLCEIAIIVVRDVGFILVFVRNIFSSALRQVLCYGICFMIPDLLGKAELSFSDAFEP